MTLFSVHLCGAQGQSCADVEVEAIDRNEAESLALERYPEYGAVRVQSELDPNTKDWINYEE